MTSVLSNDFKRQWDDCGPEVLAAIKAVGESGWYILGNEVKSFESSLAGVFGASHAIGCANGMDGLEMALRALDLAPGSKVLTTPLSAFATTLAIIRAGLTPVFVDVDAHGLIDLGQCEHALQTVPDIQCIVPVHLYGHCLNMQRLSSIKKKYGVFIVEDCAQSILASFEGQLSGSVGDIAATSFYPTKNLGALGDGGAVTTNSATLAEKVRALRDYGQSAKYVHDVLGLNSRLDEVHAAVLNKVFLPRLKKWTERRSEISEKYVRRLESSSVQPVPTPPGSHSCWHLFPLLVTQGDRTAFQNFLKESGIGSAIHYPCIIPDQRALADMPGCQIITEVVEARRIASTVISIPNHPYMTDEEVEYCISTINKWTAR